MNETAKERTDRQLLELLNELRVALPGAQVLLGFLLTAPFASRFGRTSQGERIVLFACTMFTAAGVLLLMAPSVYHRIRWNEGGKQDVIRVGHVLFLIGTGCLALGMFCALFLIGYMLFGTAAAVAAIAVAASIVASVWYVLPLRRGRDPSFRREE
jgi:predicted membrane channel-forming protein YqfA (hemolysin III family)